MKFAIVSPLRNAYSESFIQAHRMIQADTLYFYGGKVPIFLEGYGRLLDGNGIHKYVHLCKSIFLRPRILWYPKSFNIDKRVLAEAFRERNVTHVLAEFGNCAAEIMDVCSYLNIKLISHFHGYEISRYEVVASYGKKYQELFKKSYRIIAVSKLMQRNMIAMGCPESKIVYCPCGPSDSLAELKPDFSRKNILFIGRFVDKKAPYDLILAFKKVVSEIPDATLTMIGDGELLSCCKQLAKHCAVFENIRFKGAVEHSCVNKYFSEASVYCQPSVTAESGDQEGTPVSVMEASLASIPVVATRHAGIPDVVLDNITGCLVDEHDVDGLSLALIEILSDSKRAKQMGKKGREYVSQHFIQSRSLQTLRSILY